MGSTLNEGDDCLLPATAAFWVCDDPQPGIVHVEFVDANGRPHMLIGKAAYFGGDLYPDTKYPCPTDVPCTVEGIDGDIATVSTMLLDSYVFNSRFVYEVPLNVLTPQGTSAK
jgi:hypothetical protein